MSVSQAIAARRAARLESGWVYRALAAAEGRELTSGQINYAITLRRVLAESLARAAGQRAMCDFSAAGKEWLGISAACRREVRRMERAEARLANVVRQPQ